MNKMKKLFFVALAVIAGLLLTFAGLGLIELSQSLILYVGIASLLLAALLYFFA